MKMEARFTRKAVLQGGRTHMEVTLTPPDQPRDKRPVCVVLAIDMSDGMGEPERLYGFTRMYTPIISPVRRAAYTVIEELGDEDMFGCAVFNQDAFLCQEPIHPVSEQVPDIKIQISRIEPHGNRNLAAGLWKAGSFFSEEMVKRYKCKIVLIACGDTVPAYGGEERLPEMCSSFRKRGIEVSVVGVGKGYSLESFRDMADFGGGRAYHVQNFVHLPDILRSETEAARNMAARETSLVVKSDSFFHFGKNLNGFRQEDRRGRSEIFIGSLREPVSLYFEACASGTKKSRAEIELEAIFTEAPGMVNRAYFVKTVEVAKTAEECVGATFDKRALRGYLGAFAVKSLMEASISYEKLAISKMEADFEAAKEHIAGLAALYPAGEKTINNCREVMDGRGKIFFADSLETGNNKSICMELTEMLRRNGKKTIKNLYI